MAKRKASRRRAAAGPVLLVPVDGSPSSLRALALAVSRVKTGKGQVVALNVQQPMPPSRFVSRTDILQHHERMAEEVFDKVDATLRREDGTATRTAVVGLPSEVIVRQAKKVGASEIIMGTRGLSRVSGFLLGSVAMKVVQLASVPVTLVK